MKFGIVGCGYWGKNYVRIAHELSVSESVSVCEMDAGLLSQVQLKYPSAACFSDLEQMLSVAEIDVLS